MLLFAVCQRKRQQAMLAKKNAERTVRKTHFRSHHCLPRVSEQLHSNATDLSACHYLTWTHVPAAEQRFQEETDPDQQRLLLWSFSGPQSGWIDGGVLMHPLLWRRLVQVQEISAQSCEMGRVRTFRFFSMSHMLLQIFLQMRLDGENETDTM